MAADQRSDEREMLPGSRTACADEADRPPSVTSANTAPRRSARPAALAVLAAVLALLSVASGGLLWRQHRELYAELHDSDTRLETAVADLRDRQRGLAERLGALAGATAAGAERADAAAARLADLPARLAELEHRLAELPDRLADVRRRLDAAQGGPEAARAEWLRTEAEYYLTLAVAELDLAGRWESAAVALELADSRLRQLSDPAVARVRREIAVERLALASVEQPDIERVLFDLAALRDRAGELPLRGERSPAAAPEDIARAEDPPAGLGRLLFGIEQALASLVRIERRHEAAPRASTAERRALARHALELELTLARTAAARREAALYRSSLGAAAALLERDFDPADSAVRAAAARLHELSREDIAPVPPEIGRSLALLGELRAGGD